MTVKELIEELKYFDEDTEVYFQHPSHDYWHTELAARVQGVEAGDVVYSDYHSQMTIADSESESYENAQKGIVIFS